MQALFDLFPVVAFFIAFKFADIYVATGVLIGATALLMLVQWFTQRRLSPMLLVSAGLVLIFGGLTLYFHNDLFIMWKPTVLYVLFASALLLSPRFGKPLVQRMLESKLMTTKENWRIANLSWAVFFLILAVVNLVFVYGFSRSTWVIWKLCTVGLVFAFAMIQGTWLAKRAEPVE
jgi:intracellular septation protein